MPVNKPDYWRDFSFVFFRADCIDRFDRLCQSDDTTDQICQYNRLEKKQTKSHANSRACLQAPTRNTNVELLM